jgi:rhamnosyltransferase
MEKIVDKDKNEVDFDISIVIPAKNEGKNIDQCLDAVCQQETPYNVEIIVIDSGSTDDTMDIVKKYPSVKGIQIKPEEFGHGKTRSMGADMAKGHYIVFLNADAIPVNTHWLNSLIDPFKENKDVAGVFSRHIPKEGCYLYMVRDLKNSMQDKRIIRADWGKLDFMLFSTVSAAIRRDVWNQYPFEKDIIIAEDQDWAKNVLNKGLKILYEPDSMVYHSHNYPPRQLMESKRKISQASGRFKNRMSALFLGLLLMMGGIVVKVTGDIFFILFKQSKRISFSQKVREIKISLIARLASFWGRYKGWLEINKKG